MSAQSEDRVCSAPVGTALIQQLGEHPENRAVEEAGAIGQMALPGWLKDCQAVLSEV